MEERRPFRKLPTVPPHATGAFPRMGLDYRDDFLAFCHVLLLIEAHRLDIRLRVIQAVQAGIDVCLKGLVVETRELTCPPVDVGILLFSSSMEERRPFRKLPTVLPHTTGATPFVSLHAGHAGKLLLTRVGPVGFEVGHQNAPVVFSASVIRDARQTGSVSRMTRKPCVLRAVSCRISFSMYGVMTSSHLAWMKLHASRVNGYAHEDEQ